MSFNELTELVGKATKAVHANEKFAVGVLAVRAERAAQANPHDASLVTASNVLRKMASTDKLFISRVELNKIYDQLYSPNTKLGEVFAEELDRAAPSATRTFQRSEAENQPLSTDYTKVADPVLMNALNAAFSSNNPGLKLYSNESAQKAERVCYAELLAAGLAPKKVDVFAGKGDIIVCQATYETPKGQAHALVPVEIKEGNALLPTMFLSQAGFVELEKEALEQHIKYTAGKRFTIDGQQLLEVLSTAKNGVQKIADPVEMAVMQLKARKETPAIHDANGVLLGGIRYEQMTSENPNVTDPDLPKDAEVLSFADRLDSHAGAAAQIFGHRTVEVGRNMIARKLRSFGYDAPQVSVAGCDDNGIQYAANLDRRAGLKVPVRIVNGMVTPPVMAIASGKIGEFSAGGIKELLKDNQVDARMMSLASPMHDLKTSDLMAQLRKALDEGNLPRAEDAITALADKDPVAHKIATRMLMDSLTGKDIEKTAAAEDDVKLDTPGGFITNKIFLNY